MMALRMRMRGYFSTHLQAAGHDEFIDIVLCTEYGNLVKHTYVCMYIGT